MPWHDVGQDARNNVGGDIGAMFGMMTGTMIGKQSNTKKIPCKYHENTFVIIWRMPAFVRLTKEDTAFVSVKCDAIVRRSLIRWLLFLGASDCIKQALKTML